jgi:hypothetical protein
LSSPFIFEAVPVLDPRPDNTGPYRFSDEPAGGQSRQGLISDTMRPWRKSNAPARHAGIGSAGGQRADRHAEGVGRSPERGSASQSPRTHHGAVVSTAAQRTFNPHGAGANPAGSTMIHPQSMRADVRRNLPAPSDLSCGLTRRARAAKGPACKAEARGCKSRRRVHFLRGRSSDKKSG